MQIQKEAPPEYGEKILFREIESNLALKNPLIDEIIEALDEKNLLDDEDEIWARLCLDEVIINAIKHGNNENPEKSVTTSLYANEKTWAVRIEDEGKGFSEGDVPVGDDEDAEGGRGILLMKSYMNEIWYFNNGSGVQLMKHKKSKFRKFLDKILGFLRLR